MFWRLILFPSSGKAFLISTVMMEAEWVSETLVQLIAQEYFNVS
jgi:hypothetical protein